ncbi:unnamed protein product, partial [Nesidiocoris tenuis]
PYFLKNGSEWLKSKFDGENAVLQEFPEAIIFRPSYIVGAEDRFCRYIDNTAPKEGWRGADGIDR